MSTETVYDVGDDVKVQATFTVEDTLSDPSELVLQIRPPSGEIAEYAIGELTNLSTGVWEHVVTVDEEGRWRYRWVATGNMRATMENYFYVRKTTFDD